MGFTQISFLFVFLPVSIILYCLAEMLFHKDKINNGILVFLSLLFYYYADKESLYIFILLALVTYISGYAVKTKKRIIFTIVFFVGTLAFFKYFTFISSWINSLSGIKIITIDNLFIPIGISFVFFEAISYAVDIYRGDAEIGSLLDCLTFISLFPKLVSGPIVLWKDFKPQLKNRRTDLNDICCGIDRIIIGYAKKVIIADTFGIHIMLINNGMASSGIDVPTMWLKALLYFFQIYFDFSGYSDIAIGISRFFGFKFRENFNYPYISTSISEFWRRWHISLGTWFREYVYIPMGGNRKGSVYLHLAIVFLLTGIWHGNGWRFLVWGGVHGLFTILERMVREHQWYKRIPSIIKWMGTMLIVFLAWIVFSSTGIVDAWKNIVSLFIPKNSGAVNFTWQYYLTRRIAFLLILSVFSLIVGIEAIKQRIGKMFENGIAVVAKRIFLLLLMVVAIMFIVNSNYSPFIYFQF